MFVHIHVVYSLLMLQDGRQIKTIIRSFDSPTFIDTCWWIKGFDFIRLDGICTVPFRRE